MTRPIIICGHAGHGKDTVAELLRDEHGFKFVPTSRYACEHFVFEFLTQVEGMPYLIPQQCFEDRGNHRPRWHDIIAAYNTPQKDKLLREVLSLNQIYCGLRCKFELTAYVKFNPEVIVVWVDASMRRPPEPLTSNTITAEMCDIRIPNNFTHEVLKTHVNRLARYAKGTYE